MSFANLDKKLSSTIFVLGDMVNTSTDKHLIGWEGEVDGAVIDGCLMFMNKMSGVGYVGFEKVADRKALAAKLSGVAQLAVLEDDADRFTGLARKADDRGQVCYEIMSAAGAQWGDEPPSQEALYGEAQERR